MGNADRWISIRLRALVAMLAVLSVLAGIEGVTDTTAAVDEPIAVHSMVYLDAPPSFMDAMFREAVGLHASYIRLDVATSLVFHDPSAGPWWDGLDEVMALSRTYHLPVVADLVTIPWWISNCQGPTSFQALGLCGTDQLSSYASEIGQIVAHADGVIRDWEVWNEPDNPASFSGTPAQYAWMLRTAYNAIKAEDPDASVLLGGIGSIASTSWLSQVFGTPGAQAAQALDIANVHLRGTVAQVASGMAAWHSFFRSHGFFGPIWVTEHGYPSDAAFQYDPDFLGGDSDQAAYLASSIPALVGAGAQEVFVTERDNLTARFASEGLLGGDVADPPEADPQPVEKPAYATVRSLADCYAAAAGSCGGPAPAATPPALALGPLPTGAVASGFLEISDHGATPLLVRAVRSDPAVPDVTVADGGCADRILNAGESCDVLVSFAPVAAVSESGALRVDTAAGTLPVPLTTDAIAPSAALPVPLGPTPLAAPPLVPAPAPAPALTAAPVPPAAPLVRGLAALPTGGCLTVRGARIAVLTSAPGTIRWALTRAAHRAARCPATAPESAARSRHQLAGSAPTQSVRGHQAASLAIAPSAARRLVPGTFRLTVRLVSDGADSAPIAVWLTVR